MAKRKTAYVCSDCGAEFPRWQGQCSECKAWNTISEFVVASAKSVARQTTSGYAGQTAAKIETLNAIDLESLPRFSSTFGFRFAPNTLEPVLQVSYIFIHTILVSKFVFIHQF